MLHKCPQCNMPKLTPDGLARHLTSGHKVDPTWAIKMAQQIFSKGESSATSQTTSENRYRSTSPYDGDRMYTKSSSVKQCPVCKVSKSSVESMRAHLTGNHGLKDNIAKSMAHGIFSGEYTETISLMEKTADKKTHTCPGCMEKFSNMASFERHVDVCGNVHSKSTSRASYKSPPDPKLRPVSPQSGTYMSSNSFQGYASSAPVVAPVSYPGYQTQAAPVYPPAYPDPRFPQGIPASNMPPVYPPQPVSAPIFPAYGTQAQHSTVPDTKYSPFDNEKAERGYKQKRSLSPAARRRSPSPRRRSPSPRSRSSSLRRRSPSPRRRSPSPRRWSPSPRRHSPSPRRRSPSPKRRSKISATKTRPDEATKYDQRSWDHSPTSQRDKSLRYSQRSPSPDSSYSGGHSPRGVNRLTSYDRDRRQQTSHQRMESPARGQSPTRDRSPVYRKSSYDRDTQSRQRDRSWSPVKETRRERYRSGSRSSYSKDISSRDPYRRSKRSPSPVPRKISRQRSPSYEKKLSDPYSRKSTKNDSYLRSSRSPSPNYPTRRGISPPPSKHASRHFEHSPTRRSFSPDAEKRAQYERGSSASRRYSPGRQGRDDMRYMRKSPHPRSPSPISKIDKIPGDVSEVMDTLSKLQSLHMGDEIIMDGEKYLVIRDVPNCLMPFT